MFLKGNIVMAHLHRHKLLHTNLLCTIIVVDKFCQYVHVLLNPNNSMKTSLQLRLPDNSHESAEIFRDTYVLITLGRLVAMLWQRSIYCQLYHCFLFLKFYGHRTWDKSMSQNIPQHVHHRWADTTWLTIQFTFQHQPFFHLILMFPNWALSTYSMMV